jgi:hypothetical protein
MAHTQKRPHQALEELENWIGVDTNRVAKFFTSGLIVFDTNVLLTLYRIGTDAREQVFDAFNRVRDRVWVPHQAVLEFSRNREKAVVNRLGEFKRARTVVRTAAADAVEVLEAAVDQVLLLRERTFTGRPWEPADVGLDRSSFENLLDGVMNAALAELEALEAEHDLDPKVIRETDHVLSEIDKLLFGKVGEAYPIDQLRKLVEEAELFRYPNLMPPGYLDVKDKDTALLAAGDYILWRQVIDKVSSTSNTRKKSFANNK